MLKVKLLAGASLAATVMAGSSYAQSEGQGSDLAVSERDAYDVVVVTASRREERIQDIPIAVSAYSGARLQDAQVDSLADLASMTPNVQISGAYTTANIAIRGIGNAQVNGGSESGVAVHHDGAFLGQPLLTQSAFLDVERIEVLRGPQGTLFGRNATGGAINVISNKPTEDFEFGANASIGVDPNELRTTGYVSGPLTGDGKLLARLAYQQTYNEGYTENRTTAGVNNAAPGPNRLDGASNYSARAQLEWRATDTFNTRLSVDFQKADDSGPAAYVIGTPQLGEVMPGVPGQLPATVEGLPAGDPDERYTAANVGKRDIEAISASLTTNWALPMGDLKLLVYHNYSDLAILQDGDGTQAEFSTTTFENFGNQTFGELLFTSDASKRISVVLGANYFYEALTQDVSVPINILPVSVDLGGDINTRSYAVFGSVNIDITSNLGLFGGLRYTNDNKEIDEYNSFIGTLSQEASWDRITYEAGLNYAVTDNVSTYAKYSTGFKGGGYSAGSLSSAFDPELNTNYEIGVKGDYFGGKLNANLAAFYMQYEDLQVNQVIGVLSAITNAAKAEIKGVELEMLAHPTESLRIEANAAWLDATFEEFFTADSARPGEGNALDDNGDPIFDLNGNHLAGSPKFNTSVGAYYEHPFYKGNLTWGARYDWKSRLYFSEFNIPISSQKAIGTLDLSVRYNSPDNRWTASLYALNATDENIRTNVIVVSSLISSLALAQYEPGRQIGASIGFRF